MPLENQRILITGANGYLGSCTADWIRRKGISTIGIDNFSTSEKRKGLPFPVLEADLTNPEAADKAFKAAGPLSAVIHFAAFALVGESCSNPTKYFRNNLLSAIHVADLCVRHKIPHLLHSSSCSTYGTLAQPPFTETHELNPLSPYGETKRINEQIFSQFQRWTPLKVLNLRYFNPAGALLESGLGESHEPETHLIPNVIQAARLSKELQIFGENYPTQDGTCVRDFIHVRDLAEAHWRALQYMESCKEPLSCLNIGSGRGTSVREVVRMAQAILPKPLKVSVVPPRSGDSPVLVADTTLMKQVLQWTPRHGVEEMIIDHWNWMEGRS